MTHFKVGTLLCTAIAATQLAYAADGAVTFENSVQPFLAKNCYMCHSSTLSSGGLNLQSFKTTESALAARDRWEVVLRRLETGQMPPQGMPRPSAPQVKMVTQWIQQTFNITPTPAKPAASRVTARRLNRTEYNNTVRDLLGVDTDAAADFPQDDSAFGFDNIADALTVSPLLMEKYLAAAEKIARTAVLGPELKPAIVRFTPPIPRRLEGGVSPVEITQAAPYTMTDYDATGLSHPGSFHLNYNFPATGEYLLRLFGGGGRPGGSEPLQFELRIDGQLIKTFETKQIVTATNESVPVPYEVRQKITAGRHEIIASFPKQFEGLPASFNGPNPSTKPVPDPGARFPPLAANATPQQIAQRKAALERFANRKPKFDGVSVGELSILGPYDYQKKPSAESTRKIYACGHLDGHHVIGCERKIISRLANRAYRRPATADEIATLLDVYNRARERKRSFEQGITLAIETVLVSPEFLFRIEKSPRAMDLAPVSQYELASRLSYFLWSTMPDPTLTGLAAQSRLREPAVLSAQVRRMLKDPRSRALAENFAGQWLEIRRLESVQPDRDRFPDFDEYLRASMLEETQRFFRYVVQDDRSILDFVNGEYSFLNEKLARHYKIAGVCGPEFRKVDLAGTGRAGILTQASVLTVSSYGNRTSPVLRGKWVLENILNAPPPPPPPVPALSEEGLGSTVSLRQQLEQHRKNPSCASCHAGIDPLGFTLDHYDAVGLWRDKDGKFPVDSSGELRDGTKIDGIPGLQSHLAAHSKEFAECVTEKLMIYAIGRSLEGDSASVQKIVKESAAGQYRLSNIVQGIVRSAPFQMQRRDGGKP